MNNTLTCVYCGHAYPEGTPPHGSQILTDHIRVCEKHPMRELEVANAALREEIDKLKTYNADRAGECAAIEQRLATRIGFFQEALITIANKVDTSQTCSPGNELIAMTAMDALARDERCWTEAERQWHESNRATTTTL